jgi:hypothetical protein
MATNGSKWQLSGNILATSWQRNRSGWAAFGNGLGREWPPNGSEMATNGSSAVGSSLG